jgi:hypothetical protein
MSVRVYEVDGLYSVADGGGWLPGIYATPEAAELAATVAQTRYAELERMAHYSVRGVGDAYRPITVADLGDL